VLTTRLEAVSLTLVMIEKEGNVDLFHYGEARLSLSVVIFLRACSTLLLFSSSSVNNLQLVVR